MTAEFAEMWKASDGAADGAAGSVRSRLARPQGSVNLGELAGLWFETNLVWRIAGSSHAISDPGLPGRIRGAFGAALLDSASPEARAGKPCPWNPPCAFEVIFRNQGRMEKGLDLPGAWVVEVDAEGGDLIVVLRLFGFASEFAASAADAMTRALQHGLDYRGRSGSFFPEPVILSRTLDVKEGLPDRWPGQDGDIILQFLSPVLLSSADVVLQPRSLITTLAARLSGLARWHDVALMTERAALRAMSEALSFQWIEPRRIAWERRSSRQGRTIPMSGTTGMLAISGPEQAIGEAMSLLRFGERCHIGADAAYGCGRFEFLAL